MYCVNCGVELANTETKCPLCQTAVYHPDIHPTPSQPLYPKDNMPKHKNGRVAVSGAGLILFLIPVISCLFADLNHDGTLDWFGFAAGAMAVLYTGIALPLWFKKPNPVIFLPVFFISVILYLSYINAFTNGNWFLTFALPTTAGFGIIVCAVVTLTRYLKKGWLYIFGGAFILLGVLAMLMEFLIILTFNLKFTGWSVYSLIALGFLGGFLIYLAINKSAQEVMRRKFFF